MIEDDAIGLQPYFRGLIRRWKLIAGLTLAAAAAAVAASIAAPPTYEANSVVAVASLGAKPIPDIRSYLDLATSDRLLIELTRSPNARLADSAPSTEELRRRVKATAGSDPSLINLKVTGPDPQRSVGLARDWNELFIRFTLSTFNPAHDSYDQLMAQLTNARKELRTAEEGLSAMETRGRLGVLQSELTSQRSNLSALFALKANLRTAGENGHSLEERLRQLPSVSRADFVDDAAIMLIQSSILSATIQGQFQSDSLSTLIGDQIVLPGAPLQIRPPQLQLPTQPDRTVADQLASLGSISALVRAQTQSTDQKIEELRSSVTELETRVAGLLIEQGELLAQRDALRSYSRGLEAKTSEAKAVLEAGTARPRVILEAAVDSQPLSRGATRNAIIASALALMLGVVTTLSLDYFQARRSTKQGEPHPVANS